MLRKRFTDDRKLFQRWDALFFDDYDVSWMANLESIDALRVKRRRCHQKCYEGTGCAAVQQASS